MRILGESERDRVNQTPVRIIFLRLEPLSRCSLSLEILYLVLTLPPERAHQGMGFSTQLSVFFVQFLFSVNFTLIGLSSPPQSERFYYIIGRIAGGVRGCDTGSCSWQTWRTSPILLDTVSATGTPVSLLQLSVPSSCKHTQRKAQRHKQGTQVFQ